ncbi:hypothetical protein Pcinc_008767 [Petrolisthes cinctipes]|uniref:Uncharacterized protein n=1 Tax=Petrolisthes cinctipes TaxID=88211 RepID=A0AAE1G8L7_PETCI|nr:hypothetical protein Pcinc_008767 [Petrolisthes cinctipes]
MASPWSHVSPLKHSHKFVELDVLGRQHNNGTSHSRDPIAFISATLSQHSPLSKHLMEFVCGMPWSDHLASSHLTSSLLPCPPPSFPITALPYCTPPSFPIMALPYCTPTSRVSPLHLPHHRLPYSTPASNLSSPLITTTYNKWSVISVEF